MYQIYGFLQVDSKTEVVILAQYLEHMFTDHQIGGDWESIPME